MKIFIKGPSIFLLRIQFKVARVQPRCHWATTGHRFHVCHQVDTKKDNYTHSYSQIRITFLWEEEERTERAQLLTSAQIGSEATVPTTAPLKSELKKYSRNIQKCFMLIDNWWLPFVRRNFLKNYANFALLKMTELGRVIHCSRSDVIVFSGNSTFSFLCFYVHITFDVLILKVENGSSKLFAPSWFAYATCAVTNFRHELDYKCPQIV